MTRVVVDPSFATKLQESREPVDLCDESGRVLGTFVPRPTAADYEAAERARPKLSDEELERRRKGPSFTTAELIKHLESL